MTDFLIGLRMTLRPPPVDAPERRFWLLRVPFYALSYVWFRGPYGFARERYWRTMWWWHRGDVGSEWWSPAFLEVVTTCDNRRGVALNLDIPNRMVQVAVNDDRGAELRMYSWTTCLTPGARESSDESDG